MKFEILNRIFRTRKVVKEPSNTVDNSAQLFICLDTGESAISFKHAFQYVEILQNFAEEYDPFLCFACRKYKDYKIEFDTFESQIQTCWSCYCRKDILKDKKYIPICLSNTNNGNLISIEIPNQQKEEKHYEHRSNNKKRN